MSNLAKQTEDRQKRAFTVFINTTLEQYGEETIAEKYKVTNEDALKDALTDGMLIYYFIQALQVKNGAASLEDADISKKINKKKLKEDTSKIFHKISNLQIVFDYMVKVHNITLVNITTHNIAKGEDEWKAILGFVWTIIFEFHVQKKGKLSNLSEETLKQRRAAVMEQQNPDHVEQLEALEEAEAIHSDLKAWLAKRDLASDFNKDNWKSGEAFHLLIKNIIEGNDALENTYDEAMQNLSDDDRADAATYAQAAIDFARDHLNVPAVITGEDVAVGADAMSMQTYISCYRDASLDLYKKQVAPEIINMQHQLLQAVEQEDEPQQPIEEEEEEVAAAEEEEEEETPVEEEPIEQEEQVEEDEDEAPVEPQHPPFNAGDHEDYNNSTPIARFHKEQYARNEAKDQALLDAKQKMLDEAKAYRSKFSDERDHRITMALKRNQDEEALVKEQLESEYNEDEDWAKVVQYVLPKSKDASRMKSMFHSLKKTPPVAKMSMFKGPAAGLRVNEDEQE